MKNGRPYRHIAYPNSLVMEIEESGFRVVKTHIYERDKLNHITVQAVKVG